MYNILTELHGKDQPATYDRGKKCIDAILASNSIPKAAVKRGGILPFYYGYPTDHRALYADINMEYLFTNLHADTTRNIYKNTIRLCYTLG